MGTTQVGRKDYCERVRKFTRSKASDSNNNLAKYLPTLRKSKFIEYITPSTDYRIRLISELVDCTVEEATLYFINLCEIDCTGMVKHFLLDAMLDNVLEDRAKFISPFALVKRELGGKVFIHLMASQPSLEQLDKLRNLLVDKELSELTDEEIFRINLSLLEKVD